LQRLARLDVRGRIEREQALQVRVGRIGLGFGPQALATLRLAAAGLDRAVGR